ncbi:hypothetical protein [Arcobacter cloacae]|uniref:Uncharacterized protein n=1 Tax=Arcobacter cloacae TaxID=1054034 RepID=A0A4Q0ZH80_9BACT|nr:hypothetical protein [Arcobacter cloacae]RXJ85492.1 hypothetical protein CRU90_02625 [Arcobacter cloacae]
MKNTLKIIFLGIIGFAALVYFTMPENFNKNFEQNRSLTIESIPKYFDIVGANPYTKFEEIFKSNEEKFIIVLNHDALAVFKDLHTKTDKNIVLVANISNTPWLIKQIAVNGELEKMYKDSKIPLINDSDGIFVRNLGVNDLKQNKYFVFKLKIDGTIERVSDGYVKENILEKGINKKDLENNLDQITNILN